MQSKEKKLEAILNEILEKQVKLNEIIEKNLSKDIPELVLAMSEQITSIMEALVSHHARIAALEAKLGGHPWTKLQ